MFPIEFQKDLDGVSVTSVSSASSSPSSTPEPSPKFSVDSFDIIKLLSTGSSGKVFLVRNKETDQPFALKVMVKKGKSSANKANIIIEQKIQSALTMGDKGPFVPLVASWHDRANFYLLTEYFPGGDFAVRLMQRPIVGYEAARFYAAELLIAIEFLHTQNIIHRDIKPANIVLDRQGHLFLADFGLSKWFGQDEDMIEEQDSGYFSDAETKTLMKTTEDCGTPLFMSPEQHAGEAYSFGVDIWAFGVVLYRMVTGKIPFQDDEKGDTSQRIMEDEVEFRAVDGIEEDIQDLLKRILEKDPRKRASVEEVKMHVYFEQIDWDLVKSHSYASPLKPFIPPFPRYARSSVPIVEGRPYRPHKDCYPSFTWSRPAAIRETKKKVDKANRLCSFGFWRSSETTNLWAADMNKQVQSQSGWFGCIKIWLKGALGLGLDEYKGMKEMV
ncbi:kinase-like domain-containing protein [Mycena floridula]|nr:kinase-like domain-containing protein [Mycena floridula]